VQGLCSNELVTASSGKTRIEDPKRSPDRGDAALMVFAKGDVSGPSDLGLTRNPAIARLLGYD